MFDRLCQTVLTVTWRQWGGLCWYEIFGQLAEIITNLFTNTQSMFLSISWGVWHLSTSENWSFSFKPNLLVCCKWLCMLHAWHVCFMYSCLTPRDTTTAPLCRLGKLGHFCRLRFLPLPCLFLFICVADRIRNNTYSVVNYVNIICECINDTRYFSFFLTILFHQVTTETISAIVPLARYASCTLTSPSFTCWRWDKMLLLSHRAELLIGQQ